MARKGAVSLENLVALGVERLAVLLIDAAADDPSLRKRLVLAVAEGGGPKALIKAIDRRLAAIAGARGFVTWEKTRAYAGELDGLRDSISGALAATEPAEAAPRLAAFIRLASKVMGRVEGSPERFADIFRAAVADLGAVWSRLPHRNPAALAAEALDLLVADEDEICSGLAAAAAPALGEIGLAALGTGLRTAMGDASADSRGAAASWRAQRLRRVLGEIADVSGDVDAFIALETEGGGYVDVLAIAERLLDAGRAEEALAWLDRPAKPQRLRVMTYADLVDRRPGERRVRLDWDREDLRIRALEALGRPKEAQAARWSLFEQDLDPRLLRDYLRPLPDFEDDEVLRRAFAVALAHPSIATTLAFLIAWPELTLAADLVMKRAGQLDGGLYYILVPAAEALADRQPHAAVVLYRRMIDDVLERGASRAYSHAASHLAASAALADRVDWTRFRLQRHDDYVAALRRAHGRKTAFWALVTA
ncbi:MAG TPA: hypothetical protein VGH03_09330 [Caulobacteraceae bacterium]|jgi:hypothetical protein